MRSFSTTDKIIQNLSFVCQQDAATISYPEALYDLNHDNELSLQEKKRSGRLMRVNHCGEICAQGLYLGQAVGGSAPLVIEELNQSAEEEKQHFFWCLKRLNELETTPSQLAGFWFLTSFLMGYLIARNGDEHSLGFLEETEKQVGQHLIDYIEYLPPKDLNSRIVMERMYLDEIQHSEKAQRLGARKLNHIEKLAMNITARLMKLICY